MLDLLFTLPVFEPLPESSPWALDFIELIVGVRLTECDATGADEPGIDAVGVVGVTAELDDR